MKNPTKESSDRVGCKKCGCTFRATTYDDLSKGECLACGEDWPRENLKPKRNKK